MVVPRVLLKRRTVAKVLLVGMCIFMFKHAHYMGQISDYESPPGVHRFFYGGEKSGKQHNMCKVPQRSTDTNQIFTYDLPDITNYTLTLSNANKRFKEYVMPSVMDKDQAAYGKQIDKMSVYLIPFSHVDPGYGMTMEGYYASKTKQTLTNLVNKLEQYPDLTFQWPETVFLERWWRDITQETKQKVRNFVHEGRLEIMLGGWVMPDEAITHYEPVIDQLTEGHMWVLDNLGVKPKNCWINDPFGYSSTFPYLWKSSGMENMVILRMHQALKATLMRKKAMEFNWKQLWADSDKGNMFCHVMSWRGYWIGDVCGPNNQHICREYAFMHTSPSDKVVFVTKNNVAERARILYEQYRITAEVYRKHRSRSTSAHNETLFLPIYLGEDFSYRTGDDYDLIYSNYKMLFEYMNNKPEWNMDIKFGTTGEYFEAVKQHHKSRPDVFPTVQGDFFPYSDYQNDYWTGFYSTRPFIKRLGRILQRNLKLTDIFHTYQRIYRATKKISSRMPYADRVNDKLRSARRELGMFLHHDGITGTSVQPVMRDFLDRIIRAIENVADSLSLIIKDIMSVDRMTMDRISGATHVTHKAGVRDVVVNVPSPGFILVAANALPRERNDEVYFYTEKKHKFDILSENNKIPYQEVDIDGLIKKVSFESEFPPMSLKYIEVVRVQEADNAYIDTVAAEMTDGSGDISLENDVIRVSFDKKSGFIDGLSFLDDNAMNVSVVTDILEYTAARSGAYIFAPEGPAVKCNLGQPSIKVYRGSVTSEVIAKYKGFHLSTKVYHGKGLKQYGVFISTELDLNQLPNPNNKEVIIRFKTTVNNNNIFYTDQNGFQFMGRRTFLDRPIEQNYYPITTMMFIEDGKQRLTLHTGQPHGGSSLQEGWMEVMLDRKLLRDDGKGLGQGIGDNVPVIAEFVLQLEKKSSALRFSSNKEQEEMKYSFTSGAAVLMNELLNEPVHTLYTNPTNVPVSKPFAGLRAALPCDVSIAGMRKLSSSDETSLQLRRWGLHCEFESSPTICDKTTGRVTLENIFSGAGLNIGSVNETTLTHLDVLHNVTVIDDLAPAAMELRSFKIAFN